MANIQDPNPEGLEEWLEGRPEHIKDMARAYPPWKLYRMKDTGQRVPIYAYHENGTVTVMVLAEYNWCSFERRVFGIDLDNLEECDLPQQGEQLGTYMTEEEADAAIASHPCADPKCASHRGTTH